MAFKKPAGTDDVTPAQFEVQHACVIYRSTGMAFKKPAATDDVTPAQAGGQLLCTEPGCNHNYLRFEIGTNFKSSGPT